VAFRCIRRATLPATFFRGSFFMTEPADFGGAPVIDYVKEALDSLYHSLGDDEAAVEAALRGFYQTYAKPIDIPYVPNLGVEPIVDAALESWFVKVVIEGHKRIHTED
jgi:hypothetical protein